MKTEIFQSWMAEAQNGNADAAEKVRRYRQRSGEELYDVVADPYEWNNLADNPEYAETKRELRRELLRWMKDMGDLGQQTEMEALEHQNKHNPHKKRKKTANQAIRTK